MTNDAKKMVSNQKVETQKDVKNSSIKNGSILPPMATGDKANGGGFFICVSIDSTVKGD